MKGDVLTFCAVVSAMTLALFSAVLRCGAWLGIRVAVM